MTAPVHLVNAARTWERILTDLQPEYAWTVTVGEGNRPVRPGDTTTRPRSHKASAVRDHPDTILRGDDGAAATGPPDKHGLDEAA